MKAVLVVLVLLAAGAFGLGLNRGWFSFTSDSADSKSKITLTVDQAKFQEDRKSATKSVQGLGHPAKEKDEGPGEKSMDGTVVSVNGDKLAMTTTEGIVHSHALAAGVEVTCDGKACQVADLKAGMRVRVTPASAAPHAVGRIEALDKNAVFDKAS